MNDPIKKFIQKHRDEFDHLEPSDLVLDRLRSQLNPTPPPVKRGYFQRYTGAKWLAAASLLLGLLCVYWLLDRSDVNTLSEPRLAQQPAQQPTQQVILKDTPTVVPLAAEQAEARPAAQEEPVQKKSTVRTAATERLAAQPSPLASRLADSSSASKRLAAILEIEQSRRMDDQLVALLAETMNRDNNTNVRLAALDVLSQHLHEPKVAHIFTVSLTTQDDPLVQLGLVKIIGQLDNMDVEETLFALVRDPYTFAAVKDEAYAVLLRQNKL
ncbi:hypothetical protein ACFOET_20155 [Parapedobacter deserti]|uniref:HEAT repeat domain-containing protein n=1 Tax=Parapedobacter deserti TaxID=1912957 RepID=A0ABV7JPL1_9SPHI